MKTAKLKKWIEQAISAPERIDRDQGVIYGVKVLGLESRNNRNYDADAVKRAIPLYENAKVYIDHPSKNASERSMRDKWGVLKNVREEHGSLYADLHYLKSHSLTEQILEAAERFPESFGLSHNASGEEHKVNGKATVVDIEEVYSVDLVGDPATNKGLFESKTMKKTIKQIIESNESNPFVVNLREMMDEEVITEMDMSDYSPEIEVEVDSDDSSSEVDDAFRAICVSILDNPNLDSPTKLQKLRTILKAKAEVQSVVEDSTSAVVPDDTATETTEDDEMKIAESLKTANATIANLQEQLNGIKTRSECEKLLRENNREVTEVRLKALGGCDEADRNPLIESWPVCGLPSKTRPSSSPSRFTESAVVSYPQDRAGFRQALNT